MSATEFPELARHITRRAAHAGADITEALAARLAAYLALLATWNRTINLTALPIEPPTDAAIDRLVVESLVAARHVRDTDRIAIDIGSGGGSPAIPLNLARPDVRYTLVEARTRKGAFLREAGRLLGLPALTVETCRAEDLVRRPDFAGRSDLVTIRAVRVDEPLLGVVRWLLKPHGRVFWFGAAKSGNLASPPTGLRLDEATATHGLSIYVRE